MLSLWDPTVVMSTLFWKPSTLSFQPRPTPLLLIIITMSNPPPRYYSKPSYYLGLESTFLNFHSFLLSCSPHIVIYVIFNRYLIFDSWNVFQKKKFYQKSGKNVSFWNTFMIVDWKISFTFRSCIHVLNVERKLSKEKFNHMWKKNFIV